MIWENLFWYLETFLLLITLKLVVFGLIEGNIKNKKVRSRMVILMVLVIIMLLLLIKVLYNKIEKLRKELCEKESTEELKRQIQTEKDSRFRLIKVKKKWKKEYREIESKKAVDEKINFVSIGRVKSCYRDCQGKRWKK